MVNAKTILKQVVEGEFDDWMYLVYYVEYGHGELKQFFGDNWHFLGTDLPDTWYFVLWDTENRVEPPMPDFDMSAKADSGEKAYFYILT